MNRVRNQPQNQMKGEDFVTQLIEDLNLEPKEPECSGKKAKEKMDKYFTEYEKVGRKIARLVIKAAEESENVKENLLKMEQYGDEHFEQMRSKIAEDTPEIGDEINEAEPDDNLFNRAVFWAKEIIRYDRQDEVEIESKDGE